MEILGNNSKLELQILGKSNIYSINEWDAKWMKASVELNLIGFSAKFMFEIIEDDLKQFFNSLSKLLNKTEYVVELKTMEESIYLKGVITYSGQIEWDGFVQFPVGDGNKLYFKFESDYIQIENIYNSLQKDLFA